MRPSCKFWQTPVVPQNPRASHPIRALKWRIALTQGPRHVTLLWSGLLAGLPELDEKSSVPPDVVGLFQGRDSAGP